MAPSTFYPPPVRILEIHLPAQTREESTLVHLGPNLDGVGSAWFVPKELFHEANTREAPL